MKIEITNDKGKKLFIGEIQKVCGARLFIKRVKKSTHLYKKLDAFGIDAETFNDVLLGQVDFIVIIDVEEKFRYATCLGMIQKKGKYLHFKPHRAQIFLPRRYWCKTHDVDNS